jgi:hypothetical protein
VVKEFIEHISDKPWSNYTEADYSLEEWHAACLIHQHDGPPTAKSQCKLPVKTPNGALNRNGVHAAAAALAGARGGVNASSEEKAKAAKALIGFYHQMNEDPPPSLLAHSNVIEFIEHHGVKGMHWGVRKARGSVKPSSDFKTVAALKARPKQSLTNKQLKTVNERLNLERQFSNLNPHTLSVGKKAALDIVATIGAAATVYNLVKSPFGKAAISTGKKFLRMKQYGQMKLF